MFSEFSFQLNKSNHDGSATSRLNAPDVALGCLDDLRIDHVVRLEVMQAGGRVDVDLLVRLFLLVQQRE